MGGAMNERESHSRARAALFSLDAGCSRETWLRAAMAAKAAGLSETDFVAWSATAGAMYGGEREAQRVWRGVKAAGGVTAATLYALASGKTLEPRSLQIRTRTRTRPQSSISVQPNDLGTFDAMFASYPNATAEHVLAPM